MCLVFTIMNLCIEKRTTVAQYYTQSTKISLRFSCDRSTEHLMPLTCWHVATNWLVIKLDLFSQLFYILTGHVLFLSALLFRFLSEKWSSHFSWAVIEPINRLTLITQSCAGSVKWYLICWQFCWVLQFSHNRGCHSGHLCFAMQHDIKKDLLTSGCRMVWFPTLWPQSL